MYGWVAPLTGPNHMGHETAEVE